MFSKYSTRENFTVFILCWISFVSYVDRASTFQISDIIRQHLSAAPGFKQRLSGAFIVGHILAAPIFGYLGDRRSRKTIIFVCVFLWASFLLASAFIQHGTSTFLLARVMIGIFQSGFIVVSPSVLMDTVRDDALSHAYTYYNLTTILGVLFGGLLKEMVMKHIGQWWHCFYILSTLAYVSGFLLLFGLEPERGYKDVEEIFGKGRTLKATSYKKDMKRIFHSKTYLLCSSALTCTYFFAGIFDWYGTELLVLGNEIIIEREKRDRKMNVSTVFSSMFLLSGLIGITLGTYWSRLMRSVIFNIEPMICGLGALLSVPYMVVAIFTCHVRTGESLYYMFLGLISFNLVWALSMGLLQSCVVPPRRCSVRAWQVSTSALFGDFVGPFVVMLLRTMFYKMYKIKSLKIELDAEVTEKDNAAFLTLRYSLYCALSVNSLGSLLFLLDAFFLIDDKKKVREEIKEMVHKEIEAEEEAQNPTQNLKTIAKK